MQYDERKQALIQHLESHLGPISQGWIDGPDGRMSFQVAEFTYTPIRDCYCYCTIGLSSHRLQLPDGGYLAQELFMMMRSPPSSNLPLSVLLQVAEGLLQSHRALTLGEVIGPGGPLWNGSSLEALYVTGPVYLPRSFAGCTLEDGRSCVIAWLVPITAAEAAFVRTHGAEAFRKALVSEDPDLLVLDRESVTAATAR